MKIIAQNGFAIQTPRDPQMWSLFSEGRYIWYTEIGVLGQTLVLTCVSPRQANDVLENLGDISQRQYLDFRNFGAGGDCK